MSDVGADPSGTPPDALDDVFADPLADATDAAPAPADVVADAGRLRSGDLVALLTTRYPFPEWVTATEVTLNGRRLDFLAFNQWAARGRILIGFEVKVTRADWLREVRAFEKAEPAVLACDAFYVVAPRMVVQADELPAGWGLLEVQGGGTRAVSGAVTGRRLVSKAYPAKRDPSPDLPRELAARLLGKYVAAHVGAERDAAYRAREDVRRQLRAELDAQHTRDRQHDRAEVQRLRDEQRALYEAFGIAPLDYDAHRHALRAAGVLARYEGDARTIRQQLARVVHTLDDHATRARDALAAVDAITSDASAPAPTTGATA